MAYAAYAQSEKEMSRGVATVTGVAARRGRGGGRGGACNMCRHGLHVVLLLLLALHCIIMQCVGVLLASCCLLRFAASLSFSDLHIYADTHTSKCVCVGEGGNITHAPCMLCVCYEYCVLKCKLKSN